MQQSGFVQKFNYGTAKANYLHYGQVKREYLIKNLFYYLEYPTNLQFN